jgi:hypothetical protein
VRQDRRVIADPGADVHDVLARPRTRSRNQHRVQPRLAVVQAALRNDARPLLAGVMRSLCDEQWRRHRRQDHLLILHSSGGPDDPERACAAAEVLAAIQRLFASDEAALKVITGLMSGMAAEEIRCHCDMTAVEYDTTRRRIRRTMLRYDLAWSWP